MVDQRVRVGDTVVLKAGGPVMTVQALSMSLAYCAWSAAGQLQHGTFEVDSLDVLDHEPRLGGETSRDSGRSGHPG